MSEIRIELIELDPKFWPNLCDEIEPNLWGYFKPKIWSDLNREFWLNRAQEWAGLGTKIGLSLNTEFGPVSAQK